MLDYLWEQYTDYCVTQPLLTNNMIQKTEKKLGIHLPVAYCNFMKGQNGGSLAYSEFSSNKFKDGEINVDVLFPIDPYDGIGNAFFRQQTWKVPKHLFVIAGDDVEWLALDYRHVEANEEPTIVWYSEDYGRITTIAQNFEHFLLQLQLPDEDEDEQYFA